MNGSSYLFDIELFSRGDTQPSFTTLNVPIWTRNKAHFIARYLKTFTYVTKHGTYIDAFAGPQHDDSKEDSWAVKLVLENEPRWLKYFYLFEKDKQQLGELSELAKKYEGGNNTQKITVVPGDCNIQLPSFLSAKPIREKEATFCLLDQRSTECDWATVQAIASYKGKNGGMKIEIFYFLAQGWIDRAIKSWKKDVEIKCMKWWGRDDVSDFLRLQSYERGREMASRFKNELGYRYAYPFPIQKGEGYGRTMFWMIHASDHPRAPELMSQAYNHIGGGKGEGDQGKQLDFLYIDDST